MPTKAWLWAITKIYDGLMQDTGMSRWQVHKRERLRLITRVQDEVMRATGISRWQIHRYFMRTWWPSAAPGWN